MPSKRYIVPVLMTVAAHSPDEAADFTKSLMENATGVGPFSAKFPPEVGNPQLRDEVKNPISRDEALGLKLALGSAGVGNGDLFANRVEAAR